MTENEISTLNTLERYCEENGYTVFEKQAGSGTGMLFTSDKYTVNFRFMDLLPGDGNDFACFEIFPGIHIVSPYFTLVAGYCYQIHPSFGTVLVDDEHGDVFYKAEIPIIDHGLSLETIDTVLKCGMGVLDEHAPTIDALAHGSIPSTGVAIPHRKIDYAKEPTSDDMEVEKALDSIRRYFVEDSGHNAVSCRGNHWLCQIYTNDGHFNLHADYSERMLLVKIGYGLETLRVAEPYRTMVAAVLYKESTARKVGALQMDGQYGVYAQTQISLLDGEISKVTMDSVEAILIRMLTVVKRSVLCISHGVPEENDDSGPEKYSRLHAMLDGVEDLRGEIDSADSESFFGHLFGSHPDPDGPVENHPESGCAEHDESFLDHLFSSHSDSDSDENGDPMKDNDMAS